MTLGEYRVGITFNPSNDGHVHRLKTKAAEFIDLVAAMSAEKTEPLDRGEQSAEILRLSALAMTHAEDAAMWAVKAATKGPM